MSRRRLVIRVLLGSILATNGLFTWVYFRASSEQPPGFALFYSSPRDSVGNWWFLVDLLILFALLTWAVVAWRRRRHRITRA